MTPHLLTPHYVHYCKSSFSVEYTGLIHYQQEEKDEARLILGTSFSNFPRI